MNKNIIIIVAVAIVAFLAVLLIPRLLDRGSDEAPSSQASSETGGDTGSAGSDATVSTDEKDEPAPAANARRANPELEAQLVDAARQVNAGGPIVIDEITTMTAARARGVRMQYRYEISRELDVSEVQRLQRFASTQNQQTICARPETRALIDLGGEIEYVYYAPGDRFLFSTPIVGC